MKHDEVVTYFPMETAVTVREFPLFYSTTYTYNLIDIIAGKIFSTFLTIEVLRTRLYCSVLIRQQV